jgi:hypothetical protein
MIAKVQKYLSVYRTARAVAEKFAVSRNHAAKLIERIALATPLETKEVREGLRGPASVAFRVRP